MSTRLFALLLGTLIFCSCADESFTSSLQPISNRSTQGAGELQLGSGNDLATTTLWLNDEADPFPVLVPWNAGVGWYCEARCVVCYWQGVAGEFTLDDPVTKTITDSDTDPGGGTDGVGVCIGLPPDTMYFTKVAQSSLRPTSKAGRRDGVCDGDAAGRPCSADADCQIGGLADTNTCDTTPGNFESTRGTFFAGTGITHFFSEK